jgi:hypothetical protein
MAIVTSPLTAAEKLAAARTRFNLRPHVRLATAADYARWLKGHLDNGGDIHVVSDGPTPPMLVALHDFELPPLYGGRHVALLVPAGVHVHAQPLGQNVLFLYDGYRRLSGGFGDVWAYGDTSFDGLDGESEVAS